jgi:hypothetical protein
VPGRGKNGVGLHVVSMDQLRETSDVHPVDVVLQLSHGQVTRGSLVLQLVFYSLES